jgi:hypothetical protein
VRPAGEIAGLRRSKIGKVEVPKAKRDVDALLFADTDNLTKHDIASQATWADKRYAKRVLDVDGDRLVRQWRAKEVQKELIGLVTQEAQLGRPHGGDPAGLAADALKHTIDRAVVVWRRSLQRYC